MLEIYKIKENDADFCLYHNAGADETIAILGDSHAHAAYSGLVALSEKMKQEGKAFNVLCIARHAHNLVKGTGENIFLKTAGPLLHALEQKPEIKTVILITRGMPWISSFSRGKDVSYKHGKTTEEGERRFAEEISSVIRKLQAMGKEVVVQQDIPQQRHRIKEVFKRTLGWKGLGYSWDVEKMILKKSDIIKWEKPYERALNAISEQTGAEILYSNDAFCPDKNCLFLSPEGLPLYSDADHVSIEGSKFQADTIFKPWIERR